MIHDSTILVNLDQVTFKTVVAAMEKITNYWQIQWEARAKHCLPSSVWVLRAVKEPADCTLWKLSNTKLQCSLCRQKEFPQKLFQLHFPFSKAQSCCMSINEKAPCGIFFIYSPAAGSGICSVTWPTIAQHQHAKCSFKCNTYNPTSVNIKD